MAGDGFSLFCLKVNLLAASAGETAGRSGMAESPARSRNQSTESPKREQRENSIRVFIFTLEGSL